MVNRDSVTALLLLALFAGYGLSATQIDLFPGQESEPFTPRTMPYALAIAGIAFAIVELTRSLRSTKADRSSWREFDWLRAGALCLCMIGYGALFTPLGFVVATTLFLAAGFAVLGERRKTVLLLVPPAFSVAFWAVMTQLLGLYLAPGILGG